MVSYVLPRNQIGQSRNASNHKQTAEERELGVSNEELTFRSKHGDHRREPVVITDVPKEFVEELKKEEAGV